MSKKIDVPKILYAIGAFVATVGICHFNGLVVAIGFGFIAAGLIVEDREEV